MDINEQKGQVYDIFERLKETIQEDVTETLTDLKGAVPTDWQDTSRYVEAIERHIDNINASIEFGVSSLNNKR